MGYIGKEKHHINTEQQEKINTMSMNNSVADLFKSLSEIMASLDERITQLGEKLNEVIENQNNLADSLIDYIQLKKTL